MFLFILERLTLFFVVYKNHPRDFHMPLTTPLSRKSRAHVVNDFDVSYNLKRKNLNTIIFYPRGYAQTHAFLEIQKFLKIAVFEREGFFFSFFVLIMTVKIY